MARACLGELVLVVGVKAVVACKVVAVVCMSACTYGYLVREEFSLV